MPTKRSLFEVPKNERLEYGIWDVGDAGSPYQLCTECKERLVNYALRPLELFNLVSIHGHEFYLHDDFYDYETGEACQPEIEVVDADKFPFPSFAALKNDPKRLLDYSFVQYFTEPQVIRQLQTFDKRELFGLIKEKLAHDVVLQCKAYHIVAAVIGREAEDWAREQWKNRREGNIMTYAELLSGCLETDEAFLIITKELESYDDNEFYTNISALLYLKSSKTLKWVEQEAGRIKNVSSAFGQLVACSEFDWTCCAKWLDMGRPLSLIALDALCLCTLQDYAGQSIWLRELKPRLVGRVDKEVIEKALRSYLSSDCVARTKNTVGAILANLSETK